MYEVEQELLYKLWTAIWNPTKDFFGSLYKLLLVQSFMLFALFFGPFDWAALDLGVVWKIHPFQLVLKVVHDR